MPESKRPDPGKATTRIYVRRPSGATRVFRAVTCTYDSGMLIAEGRWSNRPHTELREYMWPASQILEVRREVDPDDDPRDEHSPGGEHGRVS